MHKKYHEKFKILDILAVTTQAHEGIETKGDVKKGIDRLVTTQAHEGIETEFFHPEKAELGVTTQAHEGIETFQKPPRLGNGKSNNSSP